MAVLMLSDNQEGRGKLRLSQNISYNPFANFTFFVNILSFIDLAFLVVMKLQCLKFSSSTKRYN